MSKKNTYLNVVCDFRNIEKAYRLAHRGKSNDPRVIEFDSHRLLNLKRLQRHLIDRRFDRIFRYYRFMIARPKARIVDAMTFEGRIVQHVLCDEILREWFERRLIHKNCACRRNKGTDFAANETKAMLVRFLRNHDDGYVLKMDVRKYFPSIDRETLKDKLLRFHDYEIRELLYYLIDNAPDDNGIPIGNQTSQWFALYYLDCVDRVVKERLRLKYYCRYMDDFYVIHEDRQTLKDTLARLTRELTKLKLEFNSKTCVIDLRRGFSFLGWRFLFDRRKAIIKRLDATKLRERKSTLRKNAKLFRERSISKRDYIDRCVSMYSNLSKGDTYRVTQRLKINYMIKLANAKT